MAACATFEPAVCELNLEDRRIIQAKLDEQNGYIPNLSGNRMVIGYTSVQSPERRKYCEVDWESSGEMVFDGWGDVRYDPTTLEIIQILGWDHYSYKWKKSFRGSVE